MFQWYTNRELVCLHYIAVSASIRQTRQILCDALLTKREIGPKMAWQIGNYVSHVTDQLIDPYFVLLANMCHLKYRFAACLVENSCSLWRFSRPHNTSAQVSSPQIRVGPICLEFQ